jgi:hypothetical protein
LVILDFVPISGNAAVPDEPLSQPASKSTDVRRGRNPITRPRGKHEDLGIDIPHEGKEGETMSEPTTSMCVRS